MHKNKVFDISVIVPTYNSEHTIERLLRSIDLYFKKLNIDLLLIDDGSEDHTVLIEENFNFRDNIHVNIIKSIHAGVSVARNIGIQNARGKYLMFLDADDQVSSEILFLLQDFKKFNSQIISFSPDVLNIHNNREIEGGTISYLPLVMLYSNSNMFKANEYEMSASNKLYLRKFINLNGIRFDKELKCWEDLFFNINALALANSVLMKKGTIFIYNHDNINSVTHKKNKEILKDAEYVYKNSAFIFNDKVTKILLNVEASYFISHIVGGYFVFIPDTQLYQEFISQIPLKKASYKYTTTLQHKFLLWGLQRLGFRMTTLIYRSLKKVQMAISR